MIGHQLKLIENYFSDEEAHICDNCGIVFTDQEKLSDHMKSFHQQTLFTCDICCQGFTNEKDCKEHENEHQPLKRYKPNTDEKEWTLMMYTCDICFKAFHDEENLKIHQQTHYLSILFHSTASTFKKRKVDVGQAKGTSVCIDLTQNGTNPRKEGGNIGNIKGKLSL